MVGRPWQKRFFAFCQGRYWSGDPGKSDFFHFARGDSGLSDPGKGIILRSARVSVRFLTLANFRFCYLPGVVRG